MSFFKAFMFSSLKFHKRLQKHQLKISSGTIVYYSLMTAEEKREEIPTSSFFHVLCSSFCSTLWSLIEAMWLLAMVSFA